MNTDCQEHWLELRAADGHRLDAFHVVPQESRGTVVVLQEIFGVNSHIQSVARELANAGYTAIVPALFDRVQKNVALGYDKAGIDAGKALVADISLESALLDTACAVACRDLSTPAVVLGFCWGGSLAWLAAGRLPVSGAVAYYGGQIGALLETGPVKPVMTHFGADDASIPIEVSGKISQRYGLVVNHVYPAGHGFNCSERASFHAPSATLAWRRTLGFLAAVM